jgi:hypothetical protein
VGEPDNISQALQLGCFLLTAILFANNLNVSELVFMVPTAKESGWYGERNAQNKHLIDRARRIKLIVLKAGSPGMSLALLSD